MYTIIKVTPEISKSIRIFCSKEGITFGELAKKLKVASSSVTRWANGQAKTIRPLHWHALEPLLRPYLEDTATTTLPMPCVPALPTDEQILVDQYKELSQEEKTALIKELIIKNESKKMRKTS